MTRKTLQIVVALVIIVLAIPPVNAGSTAFVNVNVVPMNIETIIAGQTVIVANGVIVSIGDVDVIPVPEEAEVVDGTDRYLMPGLTEMHAHVPDAAADDLDRIFTLFVANGVTTVRSMLGHRSHLRLRQEILGALVFRPRLIVSGPSLNGNSVTGAADAGRKVRAQHVAGYDFIKLHPGLSSDEFLAIAEVANELGMPFAGHVPVAVGVRGALRAGMATIDHLDGYLASLLPANHDTSGGYGGFFDVLLANEAITDKIAGIAAETARAGTWNVATESMFEHRVSRISPDELRNKPEMQYMPRAIVRRWVATKERQLNERGFDAEVAARAIEIRRMTIYALHEAGAGLLLGSDAPQVFNVPGFSLHQELEYLVLAGLTPFEALRSGTSAAAAFLGINAGEVSVGRDADLVLLDANPLSDITNSHRIHGVMLRGAWYSAKDLEQRLLPLRSSTGE